MALFWGRSRAIALSWRDRERGDRNSKLMISGMSDRNSKLMFSGMSVLPSCALSFLGEKPVETFSGRCRQVLQCSVLMHTCRHLDVRVELKQGATSRFHRSPCGQLHTTRIAQAFKSTRRYHSRDQVWHCSPRVTLRVGRDPRMHEVAHSGGRPVCVTRPLPCELFWFSR